MFYTYADAVEGIVDYLGGGISDVVVRDAKRAVQDAYRDLANAHTWTYLYRLGRVITSAPVGAVLDADSSPPPYTVTYTHTGGLNERMATVSGTTWPSWASFGFLRVGQVNYRVERRISDTVVTLDRELNPGVDITAPSAFVLYQDTYLLPDDYIAQDQGLYECNFGGMTFTHPREWAHDSRYRYSQGTPQFYTVMSAPQAPGRLCIVVWPFPSDARTVDFIYKRRPRPLATYLVTGSSASVNATATTGSPTLNFVGTTFDSSTAGSVVRLSWLRTPPTSYEGPNPPVFESTVISVESPTSLTVADPSPRDLASVGFTVSDPVDIEIGSMLNLFKRGCEAQISQNRTLKDKPSAKNQYRDALVLAREADSRSFAGRSEGGPGRIRQRLRDMPQLPGQT